MAHNTSSPRAADVTPTTAAVTQNDDGAGAAAAVRTTAPADAPSYEDAHVHAVYDAIAPHFSATRHKPWPRVARFLTDLPPGSVGLDVGCGNGRYMSVNPSVHMLGCDRSEALVRLARESTCTRRTTATAAAAAVGDDGEYGEGRGRGGGAVGGQTRDIHVADSLSLPFRNGAVDFAMSIAVIHHMSTPERRREAVSSLLAAVVPRGPVLLYVWALEQADSRRGYHPGCDQDTLVPWVMRAPKVKGQNQKQKQRQRQKQRQKQRNKQNQNQDQDQDQTIAEEADVDADADADAGQGTTYHRYYHLYREGELEADVRAVGGVVMDAGYEKDNWWVVCTREY